MAKFPGLHNKPLPKAYAAITDAIANDAAVSSTFAKVLRWYDDQHEALDVPPASMLPLLRLHPAAIDTEEHSQRIDLDRMRIATEVFSYGLDVRDALGLFELARDALYTAVKDGTLRSAGVDTAHWTVSGSMLAVSGEHRIIVLQGEIVATVARFW